MAAVQRLHPRHWDGHRLLRFLTGLALLALAFGTTAASAAPASAPATAVTTAVEAPAAPAPGDDATTASARAARDSDECQHDASRAAHAVPPAEAGAVTPPAARLVRPALDSPAPAGIAQQAHGSRAPPR